MDIEKVARETPKKIITTIIEIKDEGPNEQEIEKNYFQYSILIPNR